MYVCEWASVQMSGLLSVCAEMIHSGSARVLFSRQSEEHLERDTPSLQVQRKRWDSIGCGQSGKAAWRRCPEPGAKPCVCAHGLALCTVTPGPMERPAGVRSSTAWGAGLPGRSPRTSATASSRGAFQRGAAAATHLPNSE